MSIVHNQRNHFFIKWCKQQTSMIDIHCSSILFYHIYSPNNMEASPSLFSTKSANVYLSNTLKYAANASCKTPFRRHTGVITHWFISQLKHSTRWKSSSV